MKEPVKLNDNEYKPFNMKRLKKFYFQSLLPHMLLFHGRYSLSFFLPNFSCAVIASQHTPYIDFIDLVYDDDTNE